MLLRYPEGSRRSRRWLLWFVLGAFGVGGNGLVLAAPKAPPGHHVHLVREVDGRRFWRGGAPTRGTLHALAADGQKRGVPVTLFDLRHPATSDDLSGKGNRLAPRDEKELAEKLGLRYVRVSALDRNLTARLREAAAQGDVYVHCMYGVNRTGFCIARYARAEGAELNRTGLGARDWTQGEAFQLRLERQSSGR